MSSAQQASCPEPCLLFAGGGSGGHLYPGLAIAAAVRQRDPKIRCHFLCSDRPVDLQILAAEQQSFIPLMVPSACDFPRRPWRACPQFLTAFRTSSRLLRQYSRSVVFGTGGFVSVPVVLAAAWHHRPIALFEANAVPGRATSFLERFAEQIFAGSPGVVEHLRSRQRAMVSGVPLRDDLVRLASGSQLRGADAQPQQLLVLGGSQGASEINRGMEYVLRHEPGLLRDWSVLHQTGAYETSALRQAYADCGITAEIVPFIDNMGAAMWQSQLALSRSGAVSLAEFALFGLPSILMPHAVAVRDHQRANALSAVAVNSAVTVEGVSEVERFRSLADHLRRLARNQSLRNEMSIAARSLARPAAAAEIAEVLLDRLHSV